MGIGVGIDIGETAVKVAVVRTAYRKTTLEALAIAEIAMAGGQVEALRAAMSQALAGKAPDGVAAAIDGSRAAARVLALPAGAVKQLAEILPFELEAALPMEMSESVFDYRVLPSTPTASGEASSTVNVMCVIGRIDDVRTRIDLVKNNLALEPERISVGGFPLANLLAYTPALAEAASAGPVVIVDLGTRASEVLLLAGGEPVLARTVSFGTHGLPGTAPKLARELRVTIASHRAQGGDAPAKVFLCGGGAFVSGACAFLSKELDLPVEVLAPPALDLTLVGPERAMEMPRFAKALGLALGLGGRGMVDLRRGPLSYERGFAWVKDKIPVLAGLGVVIVVSFFFSAWAQLYSAGKDRLALEAALSTVSKDVLGEETSSASRAQELLSQQGTSADDNPLPHADAFDVMVKLSEVVPATMTHDVEELDVQKQHATLQGIVGSIAEAQTIKTSMEAERCFSEVKTSRFSQVVGGERQKYVLELDLKCPEEIKSDKKKPTAASSDSATPADKEGK